ncbi:hypothetical protein GS399_09605 [Pedobacter sp. HMF7647]|uniref:Uncharacterized protein n=1 Tax=Hufsiella arboris TaxID=2695275 RepID=A0A7K1Y9F1_9SPHI|nr:hypothetical protein [Hufsiella arboris]MXV51223.1 hypothetical protein [Hufsiella arboris]
MIFKKNDKVTTPSGYGLVNKDQEANEVEVKITQTGEIETFNEEDIDYDISPEPLPD